MRTVHHLVSCVLVEGCLSCCKMSSKHHWGPGACIAGLSTTVLPQAMPGVPGYVAHSSAVHTCLQPHILLPARTEVFKWHLGFKKPTTSPHLCSTRLDHNGCPHRHWLTTSATTPTAAAAVAVIGRCVALVLCCRFLLLLLLYCGCHALPLLLYGC